MISHKQKEQLKEEAQKARRAQAMRSLQRPPTMNWTLFNEPKRVQQNSDKPMMSHIDKVLGDYHDGKVHSSSSSSERAMVHSWKGRSLSPASLPPPNLQPQLAVPQLSQSHPQGPPLLQPQKTQQQQLPPQLQHQQPPTIIRVTAGSDISDETHHCSPSISPSSIFNVTNNPIKPSQLTPQHTTKSSKLSPPHLAENLFSDEDNDVNRIVREMTSQPEKLTAIKTPVKNYVSHRVKETPEKDNILGNKASMPDLSLKQNPRYKSRSRPELPPLEIPRNFHGCILDNLSPDDAHLTDEKDKDELDKIIAEMTCIKSPITAISTPEKIKNAQPPLLENIITDLAVSDSEGSASDADERRPSDEKPCHSSSDEDMKLHVKHDMSTKITPMVISTSLITTTTTTNSTTSSTTNLQDWPSAKIPKEKMTVTSAPMSVSPTSLSIDKKRKCKVSLPICINPSLLSQPPHKKRKLSPEPSQPAVNFNTVKLEPVPAMEKSRKHQDCYKMFSETLELLEQIGHYHQYPQEPKLAVLRLLLMSAISKKLYDIKRKVADYLKDNMTLTSTPMSVSPTSLSIDKKRKCKVSLPICINPSLLSQPPHKKRKLSPEPSEPAVNFTTVKLEPVPCSQSSPEVAVDKKICPKRLLKHGNTLGNNSRRKQPVMVKINVNLMELVPRNCKSEPIPSVKTEIPKSPADHVSPSATNKPFLGSSISGASTPSSSSSSVDVPSSTSKSSLSSPGASSAINIADPRPHMLTTTSSTLNANSNSAGDCNTSSNSNSSSKQSSDNIRSGRPPAKVQTTTGSNSSGSSNSNSSSSSKQKNSVISYFQDATKIKHEGNKKTDVFEKAYLYMRSVVYYILCGIAMEKSRKYQDCYKMFSETLELLEQIGHYHQYPQEPKLAVLRLLLMSAICKKLYDLKKKVADNLRQALDEHYKQYSSRASASATAQSHTPSPVRPNLNISTPSSRSTPSPSGSIDSIRSQGSSTSDARSTHSANTTTSCSATTTTTNTTSSSSSSSSSTTPSSSINPHLSSVTNASIPSSSHTVVIPKCIHSITRNYMEIMDYLAKAHQYSDQAAIQRDNCKDFTELLHSRYKTISLQSSIVEHVDYVKAGLLLLQNS